MTVLLSGKTAATSSIFLNCQGKREGYRKGRRSNPIPVRERTRAPGFNALTVVVRTVGFLSMV
jgi:hypothetical protein